MVPDPEKMFPMVCDKTRAYEGWDVDAVPSEEPVLPVGVCVL
jgi:hypothetical protein